ncbi:electron transport complex, RnfABCDGE type, B subunit [Paucidesulfovibrio gracilis DSM 16080]|uniref:Ion-translocating oxidoreductase complex subunit B n=1 Tax=Paucidesulfovibrio gracilis DSM 16080 TaxID=1121449 RepID=A0A1T4X5Y3_9BACT|nr:RnfABCDGE type electron transport complex subunit B [Paucidesulfovibrio gracilis]SKA84827.1 electron transport complex, RnfABCDGE type, B subunit [Paucidesulfovibrio gracilis DSM 16080]
MIVSSVAIVFGLSFSAAALLAAASKFLQVKEDPRVAKVEACLPGANCGGCGYPGCSAAAAAVVAGEAPPEVCVAGGMDIAEAIARVMGKTVDYREPQVAALICSGGDRANRMFAYEGVRDCRAEAMLYGGEKSCGLGCLGLGSCVRACPFGAIRLGEHNLPIVNKSLCRSCGKCAEVCPTGAIRITSFSASLLHVNKLVDCLAPCMQKCPVQLDVRTFIQQVKSGDLHGALLTLKNRNPLPLVVGRICPHPCEDICRRKIVDEGVAINALERYVADWEMNNGRVPIHVAPDTGRKVAIVGGGPAGLSCAYFLRRLGHQPVIFESHAALGGMLRYAIPEFRLPRNVVEYEIRGILELGVEVRTYMTFGKDFDLEDLKEQGFEAVFLATGAWRNPRLFIPGDDARNVVGGVDFLTGIGSRWTNLKGQRVIVVGGTNSAMDIARSAARLGAQSVHITSRHIRRKMSANKYEVEKARDVGAQLLEQIIPASFDVEESGRAVALHLLRAEYPDSKKASGTPQPIAGSEHRLEGDLFIVATDRVPDLTPYVDKRGIGPFKMTKQGTMVGDDATMQTNMSHVFVGGELRRGRSIVMEAVSDGRRAARSIHHYVTSGEVPVPVMPQERVVPESLLKGMRVRWHIPKVQPSEVPVRARLERFALEVRRGIGEREAVKEASRCLRCGFTCYDAEAGSEFAEDRDVTLFDQGAEERVAMEAKS